MIKYCYSCFNLDDNRDKCNCNGWFHMCRNCKDHSFMPRRRLLELEELSIR